MATDMVEQAGYKPELKRTLRFFSMFAIAFSVMSITTGIFLNYSYGLNHLGPASIWTWPIVSVGNLLIAFIVAELGTRIPLAGYAYQWSSRLVNSTYGWFVGFFGLLYMTAGFGAIGLLIGAPLVLNEFNVTGNHPHLEFAVALAFMVLPAKFNIISVQVAARVNNVAVFTEILGTVVFGVLLFVLWGVKAKHSPYGIGILTNTTSPSHSAGWYNFVLAGLLGMFTLTGFELAADLAEDAVDPRRSVPRGVIWAVVTSAVLGFVALVGFTVAIPDIKAFASFPQGLAIPLIAQYWLPHWLVKVFTAMVIFSMFAIGVAGAGAQSRLAFSMARDNMLPFSRHLRKVHPATATPMVAMIVFGVLDVAVMWYGYLQAHSYNFLVGATAIIPYIVYFLITFAYAFKRRQTDALPGAFDLGRFAWPVIGAVLAWTLAVMIALSAPESFRKADEFLGGATGLAVLWYGLVLHWRLRRGEAGVRPIDAVDPPPLAAEPV